MSTLASVLAVMERDEIDAHAWRCAAEPDRRARKESQMAREAVRELIEADRELDLASAGLAANPDPNPDSESTPEQWAKFSRHLDAKERLRAALNRRATALSRVEGGAA